MQLYENNVHNNRDAAPAVRMAPVSEMLSPSGMVEAVKIKGMIHIRLGLRCVCAESLTMASP
jgi:hypothetical protein